MSKTIIFCADGTWNGPGQDDDGDRQPDPTNVYKLFVGLAGDQSGSVSREGKEQEKALSVAGSLMQVAKYIHGVGDSDNPAKKVVEGATGQGIISRIVRGYTFISRNYEAGDDIVIVGFSRGAYTARALGGMIAYQGLLAKALTADKIEAYRWGARAWYRYRKKSRSGGTGILRRAAEALSDLGAFLQRNDIKDSQLVAVEKIKSIAVWDTVGAMGLPRYMHGKRVDEFRFTNTRLSDKVERGFHAVALDEQRADFTPTLWDDAGNVTQMVFPGAHADVGGGYTTRNNESGLSDITLDWMVEQLKEIGVRFNQPACAQCTPDYRGTAHRPWKYPPFDLLDNAAPRRFKGIPEHPSIAQRMQAGPVRPDPKANPEVYAPANRP